MKNCTTTLLCAVNLRDCRLCVVGRHSAEMSNLYARVSAGWMASECLESASLRVSSCIVPTLWC